MNRIAYLVSDYSAPSHTFVRREVAGLRDLGYAVVSYSIRGAQSDAQSLLGRSAWEYPSAALWALFTAPLRFLSAWRLALRHRPGGLRALIWSHFHFVEALVLARLMSRAGIAHLHNHFANSGATVGMIAAHFSRIPWSLTLHGISETDHPSGMLLPEKLERAHFVACASYFMQAQAMRMVAPQQWDKLHIVRCGIDLGALPTPREPRADESTPELVCVGRLSPEKGYFGLLEALSRMAADGIDFRLTIVGDGPAAADIRSRVGQLGLGNRIRFTGFLSEAAAVEEIAAGDAFVLPSLMEGLPVVLIEALALEKPALASRVAGIPELIEHDRSGLLFTPSDWTDLERQLRRLLADRSIWPAMGKAGRRRVEQEFRIEASAAGMAELLKGAPSR